MLGAGLYLALGDSITAGYGVGRQSAFPAWYYGYLGQGIPGLRYANLGMTGLTSGGLAAMLAKGSLRNLVSQAGLITITIGSNDILSLVRGRGTELPGVLNSMARNLAVSGNLIRQINPGARIQVAAIYNPLPAGPFAQYSSQAQVLINNANGILAQWANSFGCVLVPVEQVFRGKEAMLLGPDRIHPNVIGQKLIAEHFARF